MAVTSAHRLSREGFFALAERSEERLEYVAGEVVAMARGSYDHALLVSELGRRIGNAVEGTRCRSFTDTLAVYVEAHDAVRNPDVVVACPPNVVDARQGLIDNPSVLVEVTSPSTKAVDYGDKVREYASMPSVRHYLLVDSEAMHVQMISRRDDGGWEFEVLTRPDEEVRIGMVGLILPLARIYEGVALEPPTKPGAEG